MVLSGFGLDRLYTCVTLCFSSVSCTLAWNLGHKNSFLTNKLFMVLSTWEKPDIKDVALWEKALIKPVWKCEKEISFKNQCENVHSCERMVSKPWSGWKCENKHTSNNYVSFTQTSSLKNWRTINRVKAKTFKDINQLAMWSLCHVYRYCNYSLPGYL